MIQKVNSLSSNVYTSHGEILKVFFFFLKYVDLPTNTTIIFKISLQNLKNMAAVIWKLLDLNLFCLSRFP